MRQPYSYLIGVIFLITLPLLNSSSNQTQTYILHRPGGIEKDTVQITSDSLWYPSMRPVPEHSWKWITPINDKPE